VKSTNQHKFKQENALKKESSLVSRWQVPLWHKFSLHSITHFILAKGKVSTWKTNVAHLHPSTKSTWVVNLFLDLVLFKIENHLWSSKLSKTIVIVNSISFNHSYRWWIRNYLLARLHDISLQMLESCKGLLVIWQLFYIVILKKMITILKMCCKAQTRWIPD